MKRRVDEVQFGARSGAPRILTTQHNAAGPTIQYHIGAGVLKTNVSENPSLAGSQQPAVQYTYTSSYNPTQQMATTNVKTTIQNPVGSGGPLHVVNSSVNATNTIRHKSGAPANAGQPTTIQQQQQPAPPPQASQPTSNVSQSMPTVVQGQSVPSGPTGKEQFQRLKVEDALSYLDQVKYKFGNQPQVYNDFLDIMKEFKSQSIDTPGVIQRVSNLFKGHPELIVGFNTFLPPGYKIEVQANDQGVAFQVSVSMPSPSGANICLQQQQSPQQPQQDQQWPQRIEWPQRPAGMAAKATKVEMTGMAAKAPMPQHQPQNLHISIQPQTPTPLAAAPSNFAAVNRERTIQPVAPTAASVVTAPTGGHSTTVQISAGNVPSSEQAAMAAKTAKAGMEQHQQVPPPPPPPQQQQQQQQQQQPPQSAPLNDVNSQGHNLHHISQAHQSIIQAEQTGNQQNQPVEFNHAISYVNKIKIRFQSQPEKYKRFLEILHAYQKEQKVLKEGSGALPNKQLTEAEVYSQVAKLFDQQEDLLHEFGQFLPDATSHSATQFISRGHAHNEHNKKMSTAPIGHASPLKPYNNSQNNMSRLERDYHIGGGGGGAVGGPDKDFHRNASNHDKDRNHVPQKFVGGAVGPGSGGGAVKRSPSYNSMALNHMIRDRDVPLPPKRYKPICRDVTLADASKYGSLSDYAFFDKVRKALRTPEVYDNFLRCLTLFNQEVISRTELNCLISPFLTKFPELHRWFQEFLGSQMGGEGIPLATAQRQDRNQGEMAQEVDLSTCKRLGASYCALPKSSESRKCSGRTNLCREVLNDTWVSFPTWAEDSTFVTSRKTQYEETIYKCEDERFELDVVIETNTATIRVLEGVQKKISRMSQDELAKYRLDDCLGGSSPTIHQRALRRVYGDKVVDIVQGLKKTPQIAVPVVLRRLKAKDEEWRDAQKGFNKQWRDLNEKYYLKSLDHQGINFKQNDTKMLRSKSLFNEIETIFDERHEQNDDSSDSTHGPHLILPYKDKTILDDAANLLIHHVKRQTSIQKQEKTRIKQILRHFIPDLFFWPRQQLSDDERDDGDMEVDSEAKTSAESAADGNGSANATSRRQSPSIGAPSAQIDDERRTSSTSLTDDKQAPGQFDVPTSSESATNTANRSESSPSQSPPKATSPGDVSVDATISSATASAQPSSSPSIEVKQELNCDSPSPPLPPHAVSKQPEEAYTLFFANTNWYLFLRLHAILCERLRNMYERAQILAAEEQSYRSNRRESTAIALRLKPMSEIQVEDYYPTFLDMLKNILDGNMDSTHYEDSLREMFGIHAYTAFTLDRVVQNAVRQLQNCVTERSALDSVELFHQEQRKNGAGGYCRTANKRIAAELAYQRHAEANCQDENCFKVYIYKIDCRVTIELLDTETEDTEKSVANAKTWSNYVERLANPTATATSNTTGASGQTIGSGSSAGAINSANNNNNNNNNNSSSSASNNADAVEIKTEKLDDDVISSLPRRQLFLNRNIRKFKLKNVLPKSESPTVTASSVTETASANIQEKSKISSESASVVVQSTVEATSTVTNETITSTTADASVTSTATTTQSTTTSSTSTTVSTTLPETIDITASTDKSNASPLSTANPSTKPLERVGSGCNDGYFIDDRSEININFQKYRMVFVVNKDAVFYKKNAFRQAKLTHAAVTKSMSKKFHRFVGKWCDKNVTETMRNQCNDWFMGRHPDLVTNVTLKIEENDLTKTPYAPYNRYKLDRVNSKS